MELTHIDTESGTVRMIDVSGKPLVRRTAIAKGTIAMKPATVDSIKNSLTKKGDALACAQIAGIMAAKKASELIPLCHPLALSHVAVDFAVSKGRISITAIAVCNGSTGVEMEALTAVSVAALTLYDMCKAVDKSMTITGIRLAKKTKEPLR
jgi:cyclic pyranopterin phosphate synthase